LKGFAGLPTGDAANEQKARSSSRHPGKSALSRQNRASAEKVYGLDFPGANE
jgi:hypothetical protein